MNKIRKIDLEKYRITDIFNIADLQKLQDTFAKANKIASTITDTKGAAITRPSNHSQVCTLVRNTRKGLEKCMGSGRTLGLMSLTQKKPCYMKCQSIGFIDAAAPIVIGGIHMANWLIGQNCIGDVDEKRVVSYAGKIGANKDEMLNAFKQMDVISEIEFNEKLEFLWLMANQISILSYQNLSYKNMLDLLEKSQEKLEKYKNNLEITVNQRTLELTRALDEIKMVSIKDGLTGCYNRGFINENFPRELKRSKRYNNPVSIILCDIDHFKTVNDTFGHQCGDHVLKEIVSCFKDDIRQDIDWVGRYGGEEFLVVLPFTDMKNAVRIAERLRKTIFQLQIAYNQDNLNVTASFGVSGIDQWSLQDDISYEVLLNSADVYLYRAKADGRNRVSFGPAMIKSK